MMKPFSTRTLAIATLLLGGAAVPAHAQPCSAPHLVDQSFSNGAYTTEWMFCWQTPATYGLTINAAYFRPGPGKPWVEVIYDARVTDIFVPYHSGWPRYYDLSGFNFPMMTLSAADCPPAQGGTLLGNVVCKEVRDRGVGWKMSNGSVYRGREVILWSALQAAYYVYIFRWHFRDDGVVIGEIGATGTNRPTTPTEAHMHNAAWRLDLDLNGFPNDNAEIVTHTENVPGAVDTMTPVTTEQGIVWDDLHFTSLHVYDSVLKNARGHDVGYMLIPDRTGTARHDDGMNTDLWTQHDIWVTPYDPAQMRPKGLPGYVAAHRNVSNADIVVWYLGSVHHLPRDEDGNITGGTFQGAAQVMWASFMLKPHNLFDGPPLWP